MPAKQTKAERDAELYRKALSNLLDALDRMNAQGHLSQNVQAARTIGRRLIPAKQPAPRDRWRAA